MVLVTYVGSMILANDMALITFLPLGFVAMDSCNRRDKLPLVFVMQNVAANLGGMLTPFGNPQNLYLYSHFQLGFGEFVKIMALPFAVALLLIVGVCFSVKGEKLTLFAPQESTPSVWRSITYGVLFVLSLLIVFNVLPWYFCIVVVLVALLATDYKAVLRVDYGLLLTFAAFFVFSGNLARIPSVSDAFPTGCHFAFTCGRRMLSVYFQRAYGSASFAIHHRLHQLACCRQHRRAGYPHCFVGKSDNA